MAGPFHFRSPSESGFGFRRTVLVTGGSGFIGGAVTHRLLERGDQVIVLSRDPDRARRRLGAGPAIVPRLGDIPAGETIDAAVNLAGAPIFGRPWTKARKRDLVESRIGSTRELVDWLATRAQRPETLVSASAVGWYGASGDAARDEAAPVGGDFPASLCNAWEREAANAAMAGIRVCRLRFGPVLGREGGLLRATLPAYWLGLGSRLGDGRQWISWIHLADAVELVTRALADPLFEGPVNATAPKPVTQAEFAATLARLLRRPMLLRIPARPLRLGLGERATLLVDGQRVVPRRALEIGFAFRCHELEPALQDLLGLPKERGGASVRLLDHILG